MGASSAAMVAAALEHANYMTIEGRPADMQQSMMLPLWLASKCRICEKRMGWILGLEGFGIRQWRHEARCNARYCQAAQAEDLQARAQQQSCSNTQPCMTRICGLAGVGNRLRDRSCPTVSTPVVDRKHQDHKTPKFGEETPYFGIDEEDDISCSSSVNEYWSNTYFFKY